MCVTNYTLHIYSHLGQGEETKHGGFVVFFCLYYQNEINKNEMLMYVYPKMVNVESAMFCKKARPK